MSDVLRATERTNARTHDLDIMEVDDLVEALTHEQNEAFVAVQRATPQIARAVAAIAERLRAGGSLHYFGAGTSGRIATLDASECPPTFGVPPNLVVAHIAGGPEALVRSVEGAEDDPVAGAAEANAALAAGDVAVGISASGGAAYVVSAIECARKLGAFTIAVTSVAQSHLALAAELAIVTETGAEPIAGSTRLKAGTAQKLVLNALTTGAMVRLGRVYDNLMVDVIASNVKLKERALRLVCEIADVPVDAGLELLAAAGGSVKVAVVMAARSVDAAGARELLAGSGGFLRPLL